jgi:hypothetical protein
MGNQVTATEALAKVPLRIAPVFVRIKSAPLTGGRITFKVPALFYSACSTSPLNILSTAAQSFPPLINLSDKLIKDSIFQRPNSQKNSGTTTSLSDSPKNGAQPANIFWLSIGTYIE